MRTNLDGSEPRELRSGLNNPNGLALVGGRLYLTESHYKTRTQSYSEQPQNGSLYSMNVDGSDWKKETKNLYSFVVCLFLNLLNLFIININLLFYLPQN